MLPPNQEEPTAPRPDPKGRRRLLGVQMETERHRKIKMLAAKEGKTVSSLSYEAWEDLFAKRNLMF